MGIFQNLNDITIHFSATIGAKILYENGSTLGKLTDYFVDFEDPYPQVLAIQFQNKDKFFYINWEYVRDFNFKQIKILDDCPLGRSRTFPKTKNKKQISSILASQYPNETIEYPPLGKIVLDRQIVDTNGKKVVRVNDIQFIRSGQFLRVTHAEVGFRSMLRRLGFIKPIEKILSRLKLNIGAIQNDSVINWKYVHAIPNKNINNSNVKLNLSNEDVRKLHPADLADIVEDLDGHGREAFLQELEPNLAALTLQEVEPEVQAHLLRNEKPEVAAQIIENMDTDDAVDALNELGGNKANLIISHIQDQEIKTEIEELRHYEEDSAGGLMSSEFFNVEPNVNKTEILEIFNEEHPYIENIYDIFVTDKNGYLLGVCPIQTLLLSGSETAIKDVMIKEDLKLLGPTTPWKQVAEYMNKYNLINVPIVDDTNKLIGIISVDDLLPWLLDER